MLALVACSGPAVTNTLPAASGVDVPFELSDNDDLQFVADRFHATAIGSSERFALREQLLREHARRIDSALKAGARYQAYQSLQQIGQLWHPSELRQLEQSPPAASPLRKQVARVARHIEQLRKLFSRSGETEHATVALALLMVIEPDKAAAHAREIAEIQAYSDELAVARHGPGAQRSRSIRDLESAARTTPSRFVVETLAKLYIDRQRDIHRRFRRDGANFELIRAHGEGVLRTTWNVVRVYARAGLVAHARNAIKSIYGIGDDTELRKRLREVDGGLGPRSWHRLAAAFNQGDHADHLAGLRIALAGVKKHPNSGELHAFAGKLAAAAQRPHQAIKLYEKALRLSPDDRDVAESLASLYEDRISTLAFGGRERAAIAHLKVLEAFHRRAAAQWKEARLSPDIADAYAALGHALMGTGELTQARYYLKRSIDTRPNVAGYQSLGTAAVKRGHFREAATLLDHALAFPARTLEAQFNRARILRLASAAHAGTGNKTKARNLAWRALKQWDRIHQQSKLTPHFKGELLIEIGKLQWMLERQTEATRAFERAVDSDAHGASTHAQVVGFFIVHQQYESALDAYHRALGSSDISEYFKVYMSLWVIAEAKRLGKAPDRLAKDYLKSRNGRLWYDDLARFATGRLSERVLRSKAKTKANVAELLYYVAVLSGDNKRTMDRLLKQVVNTNAVMFFEYDMAKQRLKK